MLARAGGYPQTPFLLLSLAQRKKQRNIHPLQGLPLYGEDATRKVAEADDFSPFWYRGTRDIFFIGWRILLQNASIRGATCLYSFEPLFKGRRKQGCQRPWLAPKGQRLCEPYQNLDVGRSLPGGNYIPLPKIGEGLGEWSEAPSYEEGVGVDGGLQALACNEAFSFFEALGVVAVDEVVDGVVEG